MDKIQLANKLIDGIGGTREMVRLMGYPLGKGDVRVCHWRSRGIPEEIEEIFALKYKKKYSEIMQKDSIFNRVKARS